MLASVLVTKAVKQFGGLKSIIDDIPKYHNVRVKISCPRKKAIDVVNVLAREESGIINMTDGVKISWNNRSWVLIRPSGTEDIIRLSTEAKTEKEASKIIEHFKDKILKKLQEDV